VQSQFYVRSTRKWPTQGLTLLIEALKSQHDTMVAGGVIDLLLRHVPRLDFNFAHAGLPKHSIAASLICRCRLRRLPPLLEVSPIIFATA